MGELLQLVNGAKALQRAGPKYTEQQVGLPRDIRLLASLFFFFLFRSRFAYPYITFLVTLGPSETPE